MKKIIILYFSGAGCTKKVAELIFKEIREKYIMDIYAIENIIDIDLNQYDALIIGTPVYHGSPARLIVNFFRNIQPLYKSTPVFIYNTYALCSCNTNRILAKLLLCKNITTVLSREYRSPASDGVLIAPYIKRFFQFENQLQFKIERDCITYSKILITNNIQEQRSIPQLSIIGIINSPNKLIGSLTTFPIYLHKNRCVKCKKCIKNCPHNVLISDEIGYPISKGKKCENCYRCIHHCPNMALSLSKRKAPDQLLIF